MQFPAGLFARELPVDGGVVAVDAAFPSMNFAAQYRQVTDSALSQTLAAEQAHFDLGLIQPTAVFGCVVDREAVPQQASQLFAIPLHKRLAAVRVQVIHNQVDGPRLRIAGDDLHQVIGKLRRRARGCRLGKMPPRFRFHAAEDVGRATALVLVIAPGHVSRTGRQRSANVPVQHHRLFVDANHRLLLRERLFI